MNILNKNQEILLSIKRIGINGEGIGYYKRLAVFVPGAIPGEEVVVRITEVFEKPFDKDKFSYFIRILLKNLHSAEFRRSGDNIPKAFEDFIASSERLGK